MRHRVSALVVLLATAVIAIVAVAQAAPGAVPIPSQAVVSPVTTAVGPGGSGPEAEPAAPSAAAAPEGASASQVVSGTVASTSAVQVGPSAAPDYQGTEPAYMTVSRTDSQLTVTVVPR